MKAAPFITIFFYLAVSALPAPNDDFKAKNRQDAITLNNQFKGAQEGQSCDNGQVGCIGEKFANCLNGKFVSQDCSQGTICAALPLVNKPGTVVTCTSRDRLFADTGIQSGAQAGLGPTPPCNGGSGNGGAQSGGGNPAQPPPGAPPTNPGNDPQGAQPEGKKGNPKDAQSSTQLDPAVIARGFEQDGQAVKDPGQVPSLTSSNNFINFCLTTKLPITNGQQIRAGSCNPAPMGAMPSTDKMPSVRFIKPANLDKIPANTPFSINLRVNNLVTGNFVNPATNYYAAPQQLNNEGLIVGHSHVVIEEVQSLTSTELTDPRKFVFFKGVNTPAVNNILTVNVNGTGANPGIPRGVYRLSTIAAAANHQPCLVPVAQRGAVDDVVYFTAE